MQPPLAVRHVWDWFVELSGTRSSGPNGMDPINHLEIKAWADLMQTYPSPWEVRMIIRMDRAAAESAKRRKSFQTLSSGEMTFEADVNNGKEVTAFLRGFSVSNK